MCGWLFEFVCENIKILHDQNCGFLKPLEKTVNSNLRHVFDISIDWF